jgi:uncharacterized protein (DUF1499 family)
VKNAMIAFLGLALAVLGLVLRPAPVFAHTVTMAALPGLSQIFQGSPPENLGLHDGRLSPCPSTPNCVASQNADTIHEITPIPYHGDRDTVRETLLKVLAVVPRTTLIEQQPDYLRVEYTSRLLGFVDDGEFYLPADEKMIHLRSASRLGESDLGVNRRRLEQIRLALEDLGI